MKALFDKMVLAVAMNPKPASIAIIVLGLWAAIAGCAFLIQTARLP